MMGIKFIRPSKNLGCVAVRIGTFYADYFKTPYHGIFIRFPNGRKAWINILKFRVSFD